MSLRTPFFANACSRSFTECEDVRVKVEETSPNISLRDVEVDEKEISNSDQVRQFIRTYQ